MRRSTYAGDPPCSLLVLLASAGIAGIAGRRSVTRVAARVDATAADGADGERGQQEQKCELTHWLNSKSVRRAASDGLPMTPPRKRRRVRRRLLASPSHEQGHPSRWGPPAQAPLVEAGRVRCPKATPWWGGAEPAAIRLGMKKGRGMNRLTLPGEQERAGREPPRLSGEKTRARREPPRLSGEKERARREPPRSSSCSCVNSLAGSRS